MGSFGNSYPVLEELYLDTCGLLYRFFINRVSNQLTAEDLTSETFLKALRGWPPRSVHGAVPKGWLFRIARNLLADHYRAAERRAIVRLDDQLAGHISDRPHHDPGAESSAERLSVRIGFSTLSPRDQAVLSLRLAGLSNREIGERLAMSEPAAAMACLRALDRLQKIVVRDDR